MKAAGDKRPLSRNPLDRITLTARERMIAEAHLRRAEFIAELLMRTGAGIRSIAQRLARGFQVLVRRRSVS